MTNRDGAIIKVQPTTIAQQSIGITKSSKRLLAGGTLLRENATKKRKINLNLNINSNQTNSKNHGLL